MILALQGLQVNQEKREIKVTLDCKVKKGILVHLVGRVLWEHVGSQEFEVKKENSVQKVFQELLVRMGREATPENQVLKEIKEKSDLPSLVHQAYLVYQVKKVTLVFEDCQVYPVMMVRQVLKAYMEKREIKDWWVDLDYLVNQVKKVMQDPWGPLGSQVFLDYPVRLEQKDNKVSLENLVGQVLLVCLVRKVIWESKGQMAKKVFRVLEDVLDLQVIRAH